MAGNDRGDISSEKENVKLSLSAIDNKLADLDSFLAGIDTFLAGAKSSLAGVSRDRGSVSPRILTDTPPTLAVGVDSQETVETTPTHAVDTPTVNSDSVTSGTNTAIVTNTLVISNVQIVDTPTPVQDTPISSVVTPTPVQDTPISSVVTPTSTLEKTSEVIDTPKTLTDSLEHRTDTLVKPTPTVTYIPLVGRLPKSDITTPTSVTDSCQCTRDTVRDRVSTVMTTTTSTETASSIVITQLSKFNMDTPMDIVATPTLVEDTPTLAEDTPTVAEGTPTVYNTSTLTEIDREPSDIVAVENEKPTTSLLDVKPATTKFDTFGDETVNSDPKPTTQESVRVQKEEDKVVESACSNAAESSDIEDDKTEPSQRLDSFQNLSLLLKLQKDMATMQLQLSRLQDAMRSASATLQDLMDAAFASM